MQGLGFRDEGLEVKGVGFRVSQCCETSKQLAEGLTAVDRASGPWGLRFLGQRSSA